MLVVIHHKPCGPAVDFLQDSKIFLEMRVPNGTVVFESRSCQGKASFDFLGQYFRFRRRKFRVVLYFLEILSTWVLHPRSSLMVTPKYFAWCRLLRTGRCHTDHTLWIMENCLCGYALILHLNRLKLKTHLHLVAQLLSATRSLWQIC